MESKAPPICDEKVQLMTMKNLGVFTLVREGGMMIGIKRAVTTNLYQNTTINLSVLSPFSACTFQGIFLSFYVSFAHPTVIVLMKSISPSL